MLTQAKKLLIVASDLGEGSPLDALEEIDFSFLEKPSRQWTGAINYWSGESFDWSKGVLNINKRVLAPNEVYRPSLFDVVIVYERDVRKVLRQLRENCADFIVELTLLEEDTRTPFSLIEMFIHPIDDICKAKAA